VHSSLVIVVIGPCWDTDRLRQPDDTVRRDLEIALGHRRPLLPVLVGGIDMPTPDDLPTSIRSVAVQPCLRLRAATVAADADAIVERTSLMTNNGPAAPPNEPSGERGNVVGSNSGRVVQAHDIHGDVGLGDTINGDKIVYYTS